MSDPLSTIESLIRCDPARRGLLAEGSTGLGLGQLGDAARHLAAHGRDVALVTGFAVPTPQGLRPETDGPPGAAVLADVLVRLGMRVRLVTDPPSRAAVTEAARFAGLASDDVICCPLGPEEGARWCASFLREAPGLTHLVAIERVGPNHTGAVRRAGVPDFSDSDAPEIGLQGSCRNMRGESIDAHTAPLHLLFERPYCVSSERESSAMEVRPFRTGCEPPRAEGEGSGAHQVAVLPAGRTYHTIGIGDGGNEIGMGSFALEELSPRVAGGMGDAICCRIATDWTIVAGTSNWGAFGLAAAVAHLRGRPGLAAAWPAARHEQLLCLLVEAAEAVDGVTRESAPSVDGLPFLTYIEPWRSILGVLEAAV